LNREQKKREIEQLRSDLEKASSVFVMRFEKVPVSEDWDLRRQVRAAGGQYRVVKNTLAELGARGTASEPLTQALQGPTSIAHTDANPVELAKALSNYAKLNPDFTFRAGLVEGRVISLDEIAELVLLPSKEELTGKILYILGSPARGIAVAAQSVIRGIATALDQAVKENKFQ
jgi:large subunit ribosomal protein L10